jgi:hypothetical protein
MALDQSNRKGFPRRSRSPARADSLLFDDSRWPLSGNCINKQVCPTPPHLTRRCLSRIRYTSLALLIRADPPHDPLSHHKRQIEDTRACHRQGQRRVPVPIPLHPCISLGWKSSGLTNIICLLLLSPAALQKSSLATARDSCPASTSINASEDASSQQGKLPHSCGIRFSHSDVID